MHAFRFIHAQLYNTIRVHYNIYICVIYAICTMYDKYMYVPHLIITYTVAIIVDHSYW